jgi:putative endonuclease
MFTTYILYSQKLNLFYIGFTADSIQNRISKHMASHKGFTAKAKDWKVVHTEIFSTKTEAMKREKQLKSWRSHIRIKELIESSPTE